MTSGQRAAIAAGACLLAATAIAEPVALPLEAGTYEVVVNLDLPHLEGMGASRTALVCVEKSGASPAPSPTNGLAVLSENNPLGDCPASNIRMEGDTLLFEVHCKGKNAAEGFAKYTLGREAFEGTIVMKMGGKNMTMTETQKGKRVGDCAAREKDKPRS